ncbi:hypothetical protein HELRODRAFT_162510 [Helobdella robusta]|uniref:MD-2-related lipid-recognition domain-containing protein n=1 Tax=Helobdella robusta TaxID=6412 RepID=T1ESS0_HELRO|nr:hypothetical protein HELRODRAFT_162510 [Helobdella robusta]ESN99032.1 hypothetical protein HELRODRAFT_162510 [Helobdella robusta]
MLISLKIISIIFFCFMVTAHRVKRGMLSKCSGDKVETMRMTWSPYVFKQFGMYDFVSTYYGPEQSVQRLKSCIRVWLTKGKRALFDDCQVHTRCESTRNFLKLFFPGLKCPLNWRPRHNYVTKFFYNDYPVLQGEFRLQINVSDAGRNKNLFCMEAFCPSKIRWGCFSYQLCFHEHLKILL